MERPLDLNEIAIFSCVAEEGSLTAAARRLGLPKSTVSRKLAALEERLRARLMHRTPRRLELTQVGRVLHDEARTALAQIGDAAERASDHAESLRGKIRVAAPTDFGVGVLSPIFCAFAKAHPEICLEIDLDDHKVDMARGGFDLAVRVGSVGDPALIARQVASIRGYLVASPAYVARHGAPASIEELSRHRYLEFALESHDAGVLRLHGPRGAVVDVQLTPTFRVNSLLLLRDAVLAGNGIARLSSYYADRHLAEGRLTRVLADQWTGERPVHLVHLGRRLLPARVALLMDHIAKELRTPEVHDPTL